jgi:hypothetical protein
MKPMLSSGMVLGSGTGGPLNPPLPKSLPPPLPPPLPLEPLKVAQLSETS